jgi:hypothetical protein
MKTKRNTRRSNLNVESLEGREVPAGLLTASVSSAGVLSITGDEMDNVVTIKVNGNDVVLTPNATTSINGQTMGMAQTITGAATSLKADLKGGDDVLKIDTMSNFVLPKGANINLGNGDNTLTLATTEKVDLGSLAVKGGDGKDTVAVFGGAGKGSIIHGNAMFDFGAGSSDTTLAETTYSGTAGISMKAGTGGLAIVNASNLTVAKTFSAAMSNDLAMLTVTGGTYGGMAVSKSPQTLLDLGGTTVNGNVSATSPFFAQLHANGTKVTGNVTLTGNYAAISEWKGVDTVGGNIKETASYTSLETGAAAADSLTVTGNVTLAGSPTGSSTFTQKNGDFHAANVSMTGVLAQLDSQAGSFHVKN